MSTVEYVVTLGTAVTLSNEGRWDYTVNMYSLE